MIKEQYQVGDAVMHQRSPHARWCKAKITEVLEGKDGQTLYRVVADQKMYLAEERQLG